MKQGSSRYTKAVFVVDCSAASIFSTPNSQGKKLYFVTNNSTKSRAGYLKKFTQLGLNVQPVGFWRVELMGLVIGEHETAVDARMC